MLAEGWVGGRVRRVTRFMTSLLAVKDERSNVCDTLDRDWNLKRQGTLHRLQ